MNFTKTVAVALGMALVSGAASAAVTFTLDTGGTNTGTAYGNDRGFIGDDGPLGINVTADAWANTGAGATIQNAYLSQYSGGGLGVCDRKEGLCPSSPNHAVDNNGYADSVLLSFNFTVNLAKVSTGWVSGDSDFSVLYYTGAGSVSGLSGTYGNLLSSGWTLLGNYNGGSGTGTYNVGSGTQLSQYWLIMAYNGGSTSLDKYDDYFKIKSVVVNVPTPTQQSPEPATLALLGLGLAGIGLARRRRK